MYKCLYKADEKVQTESVSIEENLVITGSALQYRTGPAYQ